MWRKNSIAFFGCYCGSLPVSSACRYWCLGIISFNQLIHLLSLFTPSQRTSHNHVNEWVTFVLWSCCYCVAGSFEQSPEESLVLKKYCELEHRAFTKLQKDPLSKFIPKYHKTIEKDGHSILFNSLYIWRTRFHCIKWCSLVALPIPTYLPIGHVNPVVIPNFSIRFGEICSNFWFKI